LFNDFTQNKSYFKTTWEDFEKVLNKRVLELQYRNSMVKATEDDKLIGWGTYTIFKDYLGNDRVLVHQVLTKKEDSFKKSIEEAVIREIQNYIKKTLKLDTCFILCPDSDGNKRSLLMKLDFKKSKHFWYENKLK